jgi:hypothetical protein
MQRRPSVPRPTPFLVEVPQPLPVVAGGGSAARPHGGRFLAPPGTRSGQGRERIDPTGYAAAGGKWGGRHRGAPPRLLSMCSLCTPYVLSLHPHVDPIHIRVNR